MNRRALAVVPVVVAFSLLPARKSARADEAAMLTEVSPVVVEAVQESVITGESEEAIASLKSHQVTVQGKPAAGSEISLWGRDARCEWVMATPRAGDYVVMLCLVSGDNRPGKFGYCAGATELESQEFRQKGEWAGCVKAFRITVPDGQKMTRMFLTGNGVYFRRAYLCGVSRPIENPDGKVRQLAESSYRTVLRCARAGGAPSCLVLARREGAEARLAGELADALKIGLAVEPEWTTCFPRCPSIPGGGGDTNLILLSAGAGGPMVQAMRRAGLIGENRAIPGAGGYVIRTVARPFVGKANVIVISGGDEEGLARGVKAFTPQWDAATGDLVWDRFLVDSPGSRWKEVRPWYYRCRDDDKVWNQMLAELNQPVGSAGGRSFIAQTAETGNRYWLTGNDKFAQVFKLRMFKMGDDDIYGGSEGQDSHMELYGLMRAWSRVEESRVFSTAERLRITNYLLHRCVMGNEGFLRAYEGFGQFSWPVRMRHNHQTILGCGLMQASLYYGRLYGMAIAEVWKSCCDEMMHEGTWYGHAPENSPNYEPGTFLEVADMFHYLGLSTRGPEGTRNWPQTALRFMSVRDSFGLPACYGDCWDNGEFRTMDFFGVMRDDWGWPAAQFAIDRMIRGYRYVYPKSAPAGELYAYLNGSSEVGGVLPPSDPVAVRETLRPLLGLAAVPMTEGYWRYMTGQVGNKEFWDKQGRPKPIPYERTADKVQYRSGWEVGDEYLLLETLGWADHGHMDLGTVVQYCAGGRLWIVDYGYNNTGPEHHSTLDVKRDGKPAWGYFAGDSGRWGDFRTGPQMFEIVKCDPEKAAGPGRFSVVCRAEDLAGATWLRTISGGENKGLRIEDTLTAQEPGEYEIVVRLRLLGVVEGEKGAWQVRQKSARLPVALDFQEGDEAGIAPWAADTHAAAGGRYPWYPFLEGSAAPGGPESGAPKTVGWKRTVRLDRGQSTVFRATLGPSEKTE